ncbi:UNVERIFIED_CONTAM: hypothetical protein Sradi_6426800 [Sesamum radiatum]|uniref:Uncharacterized protein n=1 Tax=Sesamum radiatum TaxID=300843 RepID=A0AAW2K4F5_SESRA
MGTPTNIANKQKVGEISSGATEALQVISSSHFAPLSRSTATVTPSQKEREPLKEYLQLFNIAALEVPTVTQEVKTNAFAQGLLDRDFFKSLAKKPAAKLDALLARVAKYINMEVAQASKKEGQGRKRKENKDECPYKKPRTDFKDKRLAWQKEYVCWEKARGTGPYLKHETDKDKNVNNPRPGSPVKNIPGPLMTGKTEVTDPPRKGVIRMIAGGSVGGDSQRIRKAQVREAYEISVREVMEVEPANDIPLIQFDQEERHGPTIQGNDALVITALFANYEIERVFIDSGSSIDILFGDAYDQMQLWGAPLETVGTSLYGFAGEVVHPRGMVSLPLTLGTTPLQKTCVLKFLVVDIPSAYNVILGRPTLNAFRAVISTYRMKIKFPVIGGVVQAQANALQAHKCYVEAIKRGKKRRTEEPPETKGSNKWEKGPVPSPKPDKETPATVQPVEELLTIELTLGDPGKVTKIGSKMTENFRNQVINCLQKNKDIFA